MNDKMIEIGDQQFSESTIKEALRKHCGFKEKKLALIEVAHFSVRSPQPDRVIVRLSDYIIDYIKNFDVKTFSYVPGGGTGSTSSNRMHDFGYERPTFTFGKIEED